MTRRLTNAITLLGIYLVFSSNAFAQLKDNLELNLFGAGSVHTKNQYEIGFPQSAVPIPGELRIQAHARFGTRLGVFTRGHWGQEFFYSFEPNRMRISQGGALPSRTDIHLGIHNYGINALYYPRETESHVFQPFLSAGIGGTLYHISHDSVTNLRDPSRGNLPDMDNANELAFNFGLGFKTRSTGRVGLRVDLRDYVGRSPSFGLERRSNVATDTVLPATGVIHNGELSVGLVFYFGRR